MTKFDAFYVMDLETLGNMIDSVIMQAAVIQVMNTSKGWVLGRLKQVFIHVDEQRFGGRSVNLETLSWWRKQPDEVWEHVSRGGYPLDEALRQIGSWFKQDPDLSEHTVWSMPFDFAMFKHAALTEKLYWTFPNPYSGITERELAPWVPFRERDVRTARMFHHEADIALTPDLGVGAHDALWDCVKMAKTVAGAIEVSQGLREGS